MFLAMAVPAVLLVLFQPSNNPIRVSNPYRILSASSIILCLFALGFLQCRTAIIGITAGTVLIINHQYQLLHKLQNKFSKAALIIISIISITLITLAFTLFYHSKQASSDGRMFIWKISLQAIAQKPILGSGYGQFEHDYNLAQAKYFATKAATQQEIMNASYVHMSYNEFLENLFEGGIIGLVLFIGLLLALLLGSTSLRGTKQPNAPTPTTLHNTPLGDVGLNGGMFFAYAGIATFTTMCLFNFTVQAIPVRALFILYAAICCVVSRHREAQGSLALSGSFFRIKAQVIAFSYGTPFRVGVSILSVFLLLKLLPLSKAYHQCEIIVETSDDLGENEAGDELAALQNKMDKSTYYWRNYGDILYKASKNAEAVEKLQHATAFSSNPNIYLEVGNCYSRMGKFQKAITAITVSKNIQPHLFAPPLRTYESVWLCKRHRKHTVHGKRNNGLAAQDCIR